VDVISTIDLRRMAQFHTENEALATLAMQDRETSRYLLFDEQLRLCGRRSTRDPRLQSLAFSGIHVISPRLLAVMTEEGAFSIITSYLNLADRGEKILAFRADEYHWRDFGRLENLEQAAEDFRF
jgi:NDP-sugar pyrophosphorylase family protein